jgi:hypothetical protein
MTGDKTGRAAYFWQRMLVLWKSENGVIEEIRRIDVAAPNAEEEIIEEVRRLNEEAE